jgi:hypothetical protein
VLVAVLGGACGGQGDDTGGLGPTVTDSAGIEIVVNRVPPTGLPVYATVDTARDLDLGFVLGDEASRLLDVEGVVTLSNGDIAVANGSTFEIRFYGPDGARVGVLGGQGFDDWEYMDLSRMGRIRGDTLWVADNARNRLTILERKAGVVRAGALPPGYSVAGRFGDGSFLLVPRWPLALHESNPMDGVRRDPARYLRFGPQRADTVTVGLFPHDEILVVETDRGLSMGVPPFGRQTVQAVGPGRFYVGDQDAFVIDGYDPDGTLRQSIRLEGLDLSITPEQVAAVREARSKQPEYPDRFWDVVSDTRPAYGRILLDAGGNLWVAAHVDTADTPRNWMVFSGLGAVLGAVTMPRYFTPWEIGPSYVLGVLRTVGGDERVVRHRLDRVR